MQNEKHFDRLTKATMLFLIIFGLLILVGALIGDIMLMALMIFGFLIVLFIGLRDTKVHYIPDVQKQTITEKQFEIIFSVLLTVNLETTSDEEYKELFIAINTLLE